MQSITINEWTLEMKSSWPIFSQSDQVYVETEYRNVRRADINDIL